MNGVDLDDEGGYSTDQRSTIASDSSSGWNVSGTSAAMVDVLVIMLVDILKDTWHIFIILMDNI